MDERIASDARFANLAKVRQARRMAKEERLLVSMSCQNGILHAQKLIKSGESF